MKMTFSKLLTAVASVALLSGLPRQASAQTNIDAGAAGQAIYKEILGSTLVFARNVTTGDHASEVGLAGGLAAETFDWETLQNGLQWPAYALMKSTDVNFHSMFLPIVNMRGVYDAGNTYQTSSGPLVTLASDWVRYTNYIIQNYHQGDTLAVGDQAILNKLNWGSAQKLPNVGETAPPPVKYWILGNEPQIEVNGYYYSSNPFDQLFHGAKDPSEYVNRYKQISAAMKAQDPTIKVGPGMLDAVTDTAKALLASNATIDFWAYHSYDDLSNYYVPNGNASQVSTMEARLRNVRTNQITKYNNQRAAFTAAGRDPNQVQFMVTEYNPMNIDVAAGDKPSMYQALGFAETIFAFAQTNIRSGNYWGETVKKPDIPNPNPADIYPMVKTWWALRDHMGDTLVNSIIDDANNRHIYVTRDSTTGEVVVWGLNFDNDTDTSINLSLTGINAADTATLSILGGEGTRLWTTSAAWSAQTLNNFDASNFTIDIPSASILMLQIHPVPEPGTLGLIGIGVFGLAMRRHRTGKVRS